MENSYGFVEEAHVAQQSRRDKLRVAQNLSFQHHGSENLDHLLRIQTFKNNNEAMIDFSRDHSNFDAAAAAASPSFSSGYWRSSHLGNQDHNWVVVNNCGSGSGNLGDGDGELQFPPPPAAIFPNALQGDLEMTSIVQHNFTEINQSEDEDRAFYNCCSSSWVGELGSIARKTDEDQLRSFSFMADFNPQALSLSLSSSNPSSKLPATRFIEEPEELLGSVRSVKAESLCRSPKPYSSVVGGKSYGKSLQDHVIGINSYRNTGPLGPFTGYAAILKSSKFLRPAQLLLDEFCGSNGQKCVEPCEVFEKTTSDAALNELRNEVVVNVNSSCGEASTFCGSNETNVSGVGSISSESHQPEYQQKKAKLIYMLEEVCRRYKQYHQQMQIVVSSFESVAGLSSATPYISLALKTVSRHFRCLKNAISDQLKHLRKALGEDLPSPSAGRSGSKGDPNSARLTYSNMEQSSCFQNQKSGLVNNMGFLESQHVWRPQRGLPERAVAILRAWLFEHFLHPYPTDTDKHMLATQTGLSRNQVSNWFINARVRVWKPMVEEIHMLETKGLTEMNKSHTSNKDGTCTIENNTAGWSSSSEQQNPLKSHDVVVNEIATNHHFQCLGVDSSSGHHRNGLTSDPKLGMDGELMGFMPYRPSGVEVGGLGAVSLTLGLRHRVESAHQQQQRHQLQAQDDQLIRHFGGEMIHDFVG